MWTSSTSAGSNGSGSAGQSSLTVNPTVAGSTSHALVLMVAIDNHQTTDGDEGAVTSVTDAGGGSWTKAAEFCNGNGAAGAGVTVSVWLRAVGVSWSSGVAGQVTINFSNSASRNASCAALRRWTVSTGSTLVVQAVSTLANDAAQPGWMELDTLDDEPDLHCLRLRVTASELNSTTGWTQSVSFSGSITTIRSSDTASAVSLRAEFSPGTSAIFRPRLTSAPTFTAGAAADHASVYVAIREVEAYPSATITVTTPPFSRVVTQAEFNGATYGTNQVWLKYTPSEEQVFITHCNAGGTFSPQTLAYGDFGDGGITPIRQANDDVSMLVFLKPGIDYYFRIIRRLGGATNFDFTVLMRTLPLVTAIPESAFVVNDDASGFPAALLDPNSQAVIGYIRSIPPGELGGCLPSGTMLVHDRFKVLGPNTFALVNSSGVVIANPNVTLTTPSDENAACVAHDGTDFYVVDRGSTLPVYRVSSVGVVSGPIATIPNASGHSIGSFGVRDGIAYWSPKSGASSGAPMAVLRHDLDTDTPLSNLYTVSGLMSGQMAQSIEDHIGEVITLPNAVVTWYRNFTTELDVVIVVDRETGALLNSFQYDWSVDLIQVNHLTYSPVVDKVFAWIRNLSTSHHSLEHITLSTGVKTVVTSPEFAAGITLNAGNGTDIGPTTSCMMMTVGYAFEAEEDLDAVDKQHVGTEPRDDCCVRTDSGGAADPVDPFEDYTSSSECAALGTGIVPIVANPANGSDVW